MEKGVRGGAASIAFLCSIGSFFIKLPLSSDDGSDIAAALFAFLLSLVSVFVLYRPLVRFLLAEKGKVSRLAVPFKIFLMGALLIFAVRSLCELAEYSEKVVLPGRSRAAIFIFLTAIAFFVAARDKTALSKTALVISAAVAAGLLLILIFSISSMNLKYLGFGEGFDAGKTAADGLKIYLKTAFEGGITSAAISRNIKSRRGVLIGTAAAGAATLTAFLTTLLVFGGGFAATLSYPFTAAVGIVGRSDIFSGMDGFLYIIIFLTALFKSGAALFGVVNLAGSLKKCKKI